MNPGSPACAVGEPVLRIEGVNFVVSATLIVSDFSLCVH